MLISWSIYLVAVNLLSITLSSSTFNIRDFVVAKHDRTGASSIVPVICKCDPAMVLLLKEVACSFTNNVCEIQECLLQDCCQSNLVIEYLNCLKCVDKALDTTDFASAAQILDGARTHKFLDKSLLTDGRMFRLDWAM